MKLEADEIRDSVRRQIREHGRADWLAGITACPYSEKSNAARLWREGWNDAARFPLFAQVVQGSTK